MLESLNGVDHLLFWNILSGRNCKGHVYARNRHAILFPPLTIQSCLALPINQREDTQHVYPVLTLAYRFLVNLTRKSLSPGQLWCDTGRARGLGLDRPHQALEKVYRPYNLSPVIETHNATFQFGHGSVEKATSTKTSPAYTHGIYGGAINHAVVKSNYPMPISKAVMADRDTDLRIGRNACTLNKFGVALPCTADQIPVTDMVDVDMPVLRTPWNRIPQGYAPG